MTQVFVSPGVYTQEIDDTFRPASGAGSIGGALIGLTNKGIAFWPQRVVGFTEFERKFGGLSPDKYTPYAAQNYFTSGSELRVVRVLGRSDQSQGNAIFLSFPKVADTTSSHAFSGDTGPGVTANAVAAILRQRTTDPSEDWVISGTVGNFALSGNFDGGGEYKGLSLNKGDDNYIGNLMGSDPVNVRDSDIFPSLYIDSIFDYTISQIQGAIELDGGGGVWASATANDTGTAGTHEEVSGGFSSAVTPWFVSQPFGNESSAVTHNLFRFHTLAHGEYENTNYKVGITNVDVNKSEYPEFSVVLRKFNDSDDQPEQAFPSWRVSLDPNSKNYIARVIGTTYPEYDFSTNPPVVMFNGEYPVVSDAVIRVEMGSVAPSTARPQGFAGIPKLSASGSDANTLLTSIPEFSYKEDHKGGTGSYSAGGYMGFDFSLDGVADRLKRTTTGAKGSLSADRGFMVLLTANQVEAGDNATISNNYVTKNMTVADASSYDNSDNPIRLLAPFYGGWEGFDKRVDLRLAANASDTTSITGEFVTAINTLSNPDSVDFNLLAMPDIHSSNAGNVQQLAIDMVSQRGDAFFLLDLASDNSTTADGVNTTISESITEANKFDSSYAACYYPWLTVPDRSSTQGSGEINIPPSAAMMGIYARSSQPWFAPAGFNRGNGFPPGTRVRRTLNQSQRDLLYQNNVNPITSFTNPAGVVAFGQKTLQSKESVLDRINVRRMLIQVRKTISGFSKLFLFEPNNSATRRDLLQQINSYLEGVQLEQGLTEFRAVLDETTTTPDLVDRNIIMGKIFLKPTSAAEVIMFDFTVSPQGASFSE